jgi:hypothetical protein
VISVGFLVIGFALGYKVGFSHGFRCGRGNQVVPARIAQKSQNQPSDSKGSRVRDPWD